MPANPNTRAVRALKAADPALAAFIERIGPCKLAPPEAPTPEHLFHGLAKAIVSQQLSSKAAATIFARVEALGEGGLAPRHVVRASDATLRAAGLSNSKASYLRDLGKRVHEGALDLGALAAMGDDDVIEALVAVRGVGRWTAQMFLIFMLGRPDVFAPADLGLQKGMQRLLRARKPPSAARMEKVAEAWKPYRSVASWYLWRINELAE